METRSFTIIILLFISAFALTSCDLNCRQGRGTMTTESRKPGDFSGIRLKVPANLVIEQGEKPSLTIEAQPNILKLISTSLKEETLVIESSECIGNNKGINIYIQMPVFTKLVVEGSGDISTKGKITTEQLGLAVNGSGSIDLNADAAMMFCGIKGSGDVKIAGKGKTQHVRIEGSGSFKGADFSVNSSEVSVLGSGYISLAADSLLRADITGSGMIEFSGHPRVIQHITGSGKVSPL